VCRCHGEVTECLWPGKGVMPLAGEEGRVPPVDEPRPCRHALHATPPVPGKVASWDRQSPPSPNIWQQLPCLIARPPSLRVGRRSRAAPPCPSLLPTPVLVSRRREEEPGLLALAACTVGMQGQLEWDWLVRVAGATNASASHSPLLCPSNSGGDGTSGSSAYRLNG
jgi:hypothetical protein